MRKRFLLFALIAAVLLLAAAGAFLLLFPADRTGRLLADRAADALGAPSSLEEAKPSLFPLGLSFRGFRVEGEAEPGGAPDLTIREGAVSLRILPLLRRRIEVSRVLLSGVEATVHLPAKEPAAAEEGAPDAGAPPAGSEGTPAPARRSSFALLLSSAEIREGTLRLVDPEGGAITLEGIEATTGLRADRDGGAEARGELTVRRLSAPALDKAGLPEGLGPFRLRYDALYHAEGTVEAREIVLALRDLEVALRGSLSGFPDGPEGTLSFAAPGLETEDLLSLLPSPEEGAFPWTGRGPVALEGEITLRAEEPPAYRALLTLGGVEIRREGAAEPIRSVTGRLAITPEAIRLEAGSAVIGADTLRVQGEAAPLDAPRFDAALRGRVDLEALARTGLLPEGIDASGAVRFDLAAAGAAEEPERIDLAGTVRFERIAWRSAAPALDVAEGRGEIRLEKDRIVGKEIRATLNGAPLEASGRIDEPFGERRVKADVRLVRLDLDRILAAPDGEVSPEARSKGENAARAAAPAGPPLPPVPPITLAGVVRIDTLLTGGNRFLGFEARPALVKGNGPFTAAMDAATIDEIRLVAARADLVLRDGSLGGTLAADSARLGRVPMRGLRCRLALDPEGNLRVDSVRARVFRGRIEGDGEVRIGGREDTAYHARIRAEEMEANDFLSHLTPAKNVLFGRMRMESEWEGRGLSPDTMLARLAAAGTMRVEDGEIRNLEAIDAISELLGRGRTGSLPFRALWSDFAVRESRIRFDDLRAAAADADWNASGSIGFDGSLDYEIRALLSEELSRKYRGNALLGALLGGGEERVPVHLRLTGTTGRPKVKLDAAETLEGGVGGVLKRLQGR